MDKSSIVMISIFYSLLGTLLGLLICSALISLRNFYRLQRYGVLATGIVADYYMYYSVSSHSNRRYRQYKPVVRYTVNGLTLESRCHNSFSDKPYEIGDTIKFRYMPKDPSYIKIPESVVGKVVFAVAFLLPWLVPGYFFQSTLASLDAPWLVRFGLSVVLIATYLVQARRILSNKAEMIDDAMTKKIYLQMAIADLGLCVILIVINFAFLYA
ncbi:MAG: DUF3592 domain-containing protein [Clostridiales bacterium]|jgi:hypothetical protein|nr:DUF3592 domain-containing protein [Clostridiales bacterium]